MGTDGPERRDAAAHKTPFCATPLIFLVVLWAMMTACDSRGRPAPGKAETTSDFNSHIGWVHGDCLAIKAPGLKSGTKLRVVSLGEPQVPLDAAIIRRTESGAECYALLQERKTVNSSEGYAFYTVAPSSSSPLELAIGIVGLKGELKSTDGKVHADLNGDGREEYFTQCSTSEGVQFDVWADAPYKNKALWSAYYYLGYDSEANCPAVF
jgi:hypothetical protein